MLKRVLLIIILFSSSLFFLKPQAFADPDDLIIQNDGKVVLVVSDAGVLALEAKPGVKKEPTVVPPKKSVPLVSAHSESTVKMTAPINNDKKIQVKITPAPQTPAPSSVPGQKNGALQPTQPAIVKTVDQVVAQGANGQTVFSIKSEKANELTIKEGSTKVSTSLPLEINTLTHSLSVSGGGPAKVSVLPSEALKGISEKGILDNKSLSQAKINLVKDSGGINYNLESESTARLFGRLNFKYPVEVKLSAENGKIVNVSKPILFSIFGNFLK